MEFITELWNSILQPGTNPALIKATHGSFVALLVTLVSLFFVTFNIHFAILSAIASCLWAAVAWFIKELEIEKQKQQGQVDNAESSSEEKPAKVSSLKTATTSTRSRSKKA